MLSRSRKKVSLPIPINNGTGLENGSVNGTSLSSVSTPKQQQRRSNTSLNSSGDTKSKAIAKNEPASRVSRVQRTSSGRLSASGLSKPGPEVDTLSGMMPMLDDLLTNSTNQNVLVQQRQLKKLLSCLDDWDQINDETLLKLINQIKDKDLENLDEKMSPLIQEILNGNWSTRSKKIVKAMEDFLLEVLIARPSFCGIGIHALSLKFQPAITNKAAFQRPDEVPLSGELVFQIAHRNLKRLFEAFPMKKESAVKIFSNLYPYMTKSPYVHYCYVKNLLEVIQYAPECQLQILHLIIHKLTRIDVNIPREDIEQCYKNYNENNFDVKNERGGLDTFNPMEMEGVENPFEENSLIQTVDICLNLVLEHLSTTFGCKKGSEEMEYSQEKNEDQISLFTSLLAIFESEILPTFGVNNTQYLYFYLISLRPKFATTILDFLWKKVTSLNASQVIRIHSAAYISGIISRSSVISVKTVKRWLTRLADWANEYIDKKVSLCDWSSVNVEAHGVFYSVCQAIFYVFAFRNKDLMGSRKCIAFTRTLNLGRLVTSDLNPLKVCSDDVAVAFVNAAHQHQISYCYTVLERNQTITIPLMSRDSMNLSSDLSASIVTQLEQFFPFDELFLRRSKSWIDPIYRIYEEYYEEVKVEKTESWSSEHGPENEDSIEMELGTSFTDKHSFRSTHFYCNGSTPFKVKTDVKEEFDEFMDI